MSKKNIKWCTLLSPDGEREIKQHAFQGGKFLRPITAESYEGNRALCTRRIVATEEGPRELTIGEIDGEPLDPKRACRKCMKIAGVKA